VNDEKKKMFKNLGNIFEKLFPRPLKKLFINTRKVEVKR